MLLRWGGAIIGFFAIGFSFPMLQPWESQPGMVAIALLVLGLAWVAFWIPLVDLFTADKASAVSSGLRVTLGLGFLILVAAVGWYGAKHPSPLSMGQFVGTLAIIVAVYTLSLLLNVALAAKAKRIQDSEGKARQALRAIQESAERLSNSSPRRNHALIEASAKLQETLKFTSPLPTAEAIEIESKLADGISYLEQMFRSSTLNQALEDEALETLTSLQNLAVQRSRLKSRSE